MRASASSLHHWFRRLAPVALAVVLLALPLLVYAVFADTVVNWMPVHRGILGNAQESPAPLYDRIGLASSVMGGKASRLLDPSFGIHSLLTGTAPSIITNVTPLNPTGQNGWYRNDPVSLKWTVSAPDSPITKDGCVDQNVVADQPETAYLCTASTTQGGTSGPVTVKIKRDSKVDWPGLTGTAGGKPLASGQWTNQTVAVTAGQPTDALSGIAFCSGGGQSYPNTKEWNTSYSASCTDRAGNIKSSSFGVKIDITPPIHANTSLSIEPTNGWNKTDVTVFFQWIDNGGSDLDHANCTESITSSGEGNITLPSGGAPTCKDNAGNQGTGAPYTVHVDKTKPVYDIPYAKKADGSNYDLGTWTNTSQVTAFFPCSDGGSGLATTSPVAKTQTAETAGATLTAAGSECKDNVGWEASSSTYSPVRIDRTNPNAPVYQVNPPPNQYGWNKTPVTVAYGSNGDAGAVQSGVVSCDTKSVTSETTKDGTVVSGTCTDAATNVSAPTNVTVKIDMTKPVVTPVYPPGTYLPGCLAKPPFNVSDSLSGPDGEAIVSAPTLQSLPDGTVVNRYYVTAYDRAGNEVTAGPFDYPAYNLRDPFWLSPINADNTSVFNYGNTIPIKFQLFDCNNQPVTTADARLKLVYLGGGTSGKLPGEYEPETKVGGADSGDRFRRTGTYYQYNWSTKGLWIGKFEISVKIGTFVIRSVTIELR